MSELPRPRPAEPRELRGLVALVTGGSGGIGSEIARGLDAEGAQVVLTGRRLHAVEAVASELVSGFGVQLDVTDEDSWSRAMSSPSLPGPVDILVCTAGVVVREPFVQSDPQDWERMWRTNVHGTMLAVKAVLPGMLERGFGRVILISSVMAAVGGVGRSVYGGTKGAVEAFGRGVACEVAGTGVTVNAVAPGAFRTPMNAQHFTPESAATRETLGRIPEGRFGPMSDLVAAVKFVVASSYLQGATVRVDGGWSSS